MKFTEGYWLRSERANAIYASQAYIVEKIPNGMRVVAPERVIHSREGALDVATITTEFTSTAENVIGVRSYHYEAYESGEATFKKNTNPQEVTVSIDEDEAVMTAGQLTVRVNRKEWQYQFEVEGKVLTSCGFRNLAYMQYDRKDATRFPEDNYLLADYKPYMLTELVLQPGECVYGLGERFTAFVKNGQVVETWNEDGGTSSQVAYKSIPFYMTSRGYGIFVDHTANVSFEVASEKVEYVGFSVPGEELRYQFIYGENNQEILSRYTALTGKPALPPAWSFGLWLSTSFTTDYDEETTSSFIQGMKERDIPLRVFHFDCFWMKEFHWSDLEWDERIFPDTAAMLKRYKKRGLKISLWINPYIAQGTEFFKEGAAKGYLLKRQDGKGIKQLDSWQPGMGLVDFTNPKAVEWYTNKLRKLLEMGVDCFKTDFGERIPIDVEYFDGSDPVSMHNYYTFLYNQAVFDLLKEVKGEKEAVVFARSATAGSQQFPVHWGGDSSASYASMAETLRGGLSFAMSGFSFWSHDIGGFELTTTADLYKRWVQFGLLSTHSRLHGSKSYRVPWLFDEEASEVLKKFTKLKCQLMPYIYQMAVKARDTGVPVMRPMVLVFDEDPAVKYLDMQYMLGESLLVAPIFQENGEVDYYLPHGKWTHLLSGEIREGGCWYHDQYDYFSLPLYVSPNTLLAVGANKEKPDYDYTSGITFHLYQLADGNKAAAKVPGLKGEIMMISSAERIGNKIILSTSKLAKDMGFVLHDICNLKDIQGASYSVDGDKVKIIPEEKEVIVEI
ncbi:alpha-xylosidase [Iocasia frigidifontis]|uniref:alpha-D-xyloside xylohydrolase n=1 Tax=Iocasia fonsfrigidae TaxID=2682810 RepID=A0A8A7KB04_9FIRM|nr:alpha-xylosidase [Iocasia fonsfrigidae]QTL98631.1 alpha-xylosidase [Iocasia fonsfrigidae]